MNNIRKENSIKTLSKLFYLVLLFSFSCELYAAQVSGLYQTKVIVGSQDADERGVAFDLALKQVLVRISGNQTVLNNTQLIQSIYRPDQFVQKYSYETLSSAEQGAAINLLSTPKAADRSSGQPGTSGRYRLNVSFSRLSVNNLLKTHNEPIWGGNRPTVLLWMAADGGKGRSVVDAGTNSKVSSALNYAAKVRGVPLYLPVMDLQDESAVNSSDIWGLFIDSLVDASARYSADSLVVSRLQRMSNGKWAGQWVFELKGDVYNGSVSETSLDAAAAALIADVADKLSDRYAVRGGQAALLNSQIELEISDINTMEDYVGAIRYIESLPPVTKAQLVWVKGERIRFELTLGSYLEQLQEHIELDTMLSAEVSQSFDPTDQQRLSYRWLRSTLRKPDSSEPNEKTLDSTPSSGNAEKTAE